MKVIRKTEKHTAFFFELCIGDVFLFDNKPFIKTCSCKIGTIDDFINAACLNDGEMYGFNVWDEVELVNAELTIKT